MSKWLIAPECRTFIYELGEKGTNRWFCQVQAAGPEKASLQECAEVAALMADAPALLDALECLLKLLNNAQEFHASASVARALITKHRGGS